MSDPQQHPRRLDEPRVTVWRSERDGNTLLLRLGDGRLYEIPAGTSDLVLALEYNGTEWRELS